MRPRRPLGPCRARRARRTGFKAALIARMTGFPAPPRHQFTSSSTSQRVVQTFLKCLLAPRSQQLPELLFVQLVRVVAGPVRTELKWGVSVRLLEAGLRWNVVIVHFIAWLERFSADMAERQIAHLAQGSLRDDLDGHERCSLRRLTFELRCPRRQAL